MSNFLFIKPQIIRTNMMDNDDMIKTFVSMYLDQCKEDFRTLSQAVDEQDLFNISSCIHHIKPTMEYIGATDVRMQFQEIENMAKDKQAITEIQDKFDLLEANFHALMDELKTFYSSLN